jgi:hypothetical protein
LLFVIDAAEAQRVNERREKCHTGGLVACVTNWRVISPSGASRCGLAVGVVLNGCSRPREK